MQKNSVRVREATNDNKTWRMRFECRITKVAHTHSKYVLRTVFTLQQRLKERSPILRCTYSASS
jgi:hypothetical protein